MIREMDAPIKRDQSIPAEFPRHLLALDYGIKGLRTVPCRVLKGYYLGLVVVGNCEVHTHKSIYHRLQSISLVWALLIYTHTF